MDIVVRKPTQQELEDLKTRPTWECDISEFDWHYDQEEIALLVEGEVAVEYDGGCATFGPGDYIVFPRGLSCVWKVTKPVKKHYLFR